MQRKHIVKNIVFLIISTFTINAGSTTGILKEVGSIAKSESLSPSCFIMHADQEEPDVLAFQDKMVELMKLAGLSVLYASHGDNHGLAVGENIQDYMLQGITKSDFIFAFYSPKFFDRSNNPVSGISTEINILIERFKSGALTCFIPIIISGNLDTSVPYCLRNLYAAQSVAEGNTYSLESFEKELVHLFCYRIFKHSQSIQNLLRDYLDNNAKGYIPDDNQGTQSSALSIYMSSLGSDAMPGSQEGSSLRIIQMTPSDSQNTQSSIPSIYMSSLGLDPTSQDTDVIVVG